MKKSAFAGTLKVEIIKPVTDTWDHVGPRLRALRRTVGPALNLTMRGLYCEGVDLVNSAPEDVNLNSTIFKFSVEKPLHSNWNKILEREADINANREKQWQVPPDALAHVPSYWAGETRHNIASRFAGEHLKDLIANRASFPSWHRSAAFYARSDKCRVEGPSSKAVLTLPLWGNGKKATRLVVAPCGNSAEAIWRRLVAGELKLGRIGVTYSERKRKWYALVSWSSAEVPALTGKKMAAAHIGITRFVQIVAADGTEHNVSGEDILVTRQRFAHRRASIQRCLNDMGSGSKGRGVKRRMRPITRLEDAESRFVTTRIRQVAHGIITWCMAHDIGLLLWPDMTGSREGFEHKTGGEAHEDVRRMIHEFPFYELQCAVVRDGKERGVRVDVHSVAYDSQTCPECGHASLGNLKDKPQRVEVIDYHGRRFERKEILKRFKCEKCGHKSHRDIVACVNALARNGQEGAKDKVRKRVRAAVKTQLEVTE